MFKTKKISSTNSFAFRLPAPRLPAIVLAALALSVSVAACSPTNNVVTNAAKAAMEDRLTEEQVVDAKIKTTALESLYDIDKMLAVDLSVDVWKTRLMITGTLSSASLRNDVARALQKDSRISAFYNEIQLVTEDEQAQRREWKEKAKAGADKAAEAFGDFWIETKISGKLIAADGVSSVNYRWRSVLGTVYLLGEAGSARELNTVVTLIKDTKGVVALKSYAIVRN